MIILKIKKSRMDNIIIPIKNDGISNFNEPIDTNRLTQMDRWNDLEESLTREELIKIEEDDDSVKFEFID